MITTVAEHSVDLDLLPPQANILDLGCFGFQFCDYMRSLGHKVWPVDIQELQAGKSYYQVAITNRDGRCGVLRTEDKQATKIKEGDEIPCYTLDSFIKACDVRFDLIKADIEGAEYDVIMSLTKAPAKQLSVEFHLHTGAYTQKEMKDMESHLQKLGYEFASHQLTEQHGAGFNYWSSLFIHYK